MPARGFARQSSNEWQAASGSILTQNVLQEIWMAVSQHQKPGGSSHRLYASGPRDRRPFPEDAASLRQVRNGETLCGEFFE